MLLNNIASWRGREFHNLGAATWKDLSPSVTLVLNVDDASKIPPDDLRLYVPCDFKETKFWMYVGAIPWIALNANNKILKWMRCFYVCIVNAFQMSLNLCTVLLHNVTYIVLLSYKLALNFVFKQKSVLIAWKSFDCPIVPLHEVFLYDTPLKLTLDHAQLVFYSDPELSCQFPKSRGDR